MVGALLEKLGSGAPQQLSTPEPAEFRFVPARWLVVALAVFRLFVTRGKLGIVGIVWTVAPRRLKIAAVGLALAATIVLAGALASIALLALQLS